MPAPFRLTVPVPSEAAEQTALLRWTELARAQYPALRWLLAIPNGLAASSKGAAKRMKEQGMKAGVPDLFLPAPIPPHAGLWIEMKNRQGGRVSDVQREWHAYLAEAGYRVEVCRGWDEARLTLLDYLRQEPGESYAPCCIPHEQRRQ